MILGCNATVWKPSLPTFWRKKVFQCVWQQCTLNISVQFSSVAQSCLTLCDPMDCSTPGLPVHHQLPELLKLMSIESVMPSSLCCTPLLPPSIFPSIRVFSNESVLRIRWPKYWSFSFGISLSNEYSGLISFRIGWLDLLIFRIILVKLTDIQETHWSSLYFQSWLLVWGVSFLWISHFFVTNMECCSTSTYK